jgi:hypothetical protein
MWKSIGCYLSGHHEYGIACEPGSIFLRCVNCGKRSTGWAVQGHQAMITAPGRGSERPAASQAGRALPFPSREGVRQTRTA